MKNLFFTPAGSLVVKPSTNLQKYDDVKQSGLKGRYISAQGIALGKGVQRKISPERA